MRSGPSESLTSVPPDLFSTRRSRTTMRARLRVMPSATCAPPAPAASGWPADELRRPLTVTASFAWLPPQAARARHIAKPIRVGVILYVSSAGRDTDADNCGTENSGIRDRGCGALAARAAGAELAELVAAPALEGTERIQGDNRASVLGARGNAGRSFGQGSPRLRL